jgi:sigma-B regulation protein RsbU (phosphoserine phosphatase)
MQHAASGRHPAQREAAQVLVEHLFCEQFPEISGIEVATEYRVASKEEHVGGDVMDVYEMDDGRTAITIADIAGNGPEAARLAALVKYGLRAYASAGFTPAKVLAHLNDLYVENVRFERVEPGSFATVFFCILNREKTAMTYCSAGHDPMLLMLPNRFPEFLAQTGPLLGAFKEFSSWMEEETVTLAPDTELIVMTDGVTEARQADGMLLGREAVQSCIDANRSVPPAGQVRLLLELAERHCAGVCVDDMAVLVLRLR